MADTTIDTGKGSLTLTGKAPSAVEQIVVNPGKGTLTLTGFAPTLFAGALWGGDADLPYVVAEATGRFGVVLQADIELPAVEHEVSFGWRGDAQLPAIDSVGSTLGVGSFLSGLGVLPAVRAEATASLSQGFDADISLPSINATAALFIGTAFNADIALPAITGEGTFSETIAFSADITLPAVVADSAVLLGGILFQGTAVILPAIEADGAFTVSSTVVYFGLSTNTFNFGHGKYVNTDYDGTGRLGASTYAAMSDGLYRLDGDDDDGVPIEAYFLSGYEDFGNEAVKSQRVAYLGGSWDGALELLVRADKKGSDLFSYAVEDPHQTAENDSAARIKIGRGIQGRYWQTGLRNCDGAEFYIDRVGLGVWTSTRKR